MAGGLWTGSTDDIMTWNATDCRPAPSNTTSCDDRNFCTHTSRTCTGHVASATKQLSFLFYFTLTTNSRVRCMAALLDSTALDYRRKGNVEALFMKQTQCLFTDTAHTAHAEREGLEAALTVLPCKRPRSGARQHPNTHAPQPNGLFP